MIVSALLVLILEELVESWRYRYTRRNILNDGVINMRYAIKNYIQVLFLNIFGQIFNRTMFEIRSYSSEIEND